VFHVILLARPLINTRENCPSIVFLARLRKRYRLLLRAEIADIVAGHCGRGK
jgi:hypothetical protein